MQRLYQSYFKHRLSKIAHWMEHPIETQKRCRCQLIAAGKNTEFGKMFHFEDITTMEDFRRLVPVSDYDHLQPYIQRMREGESNVLWNRPIPWFSKSSGTTSDRSKFIPVSRKSLITNHYSAGHDLYALYINHHPNNQLFTGKAMALCGSLDKNSRFRYYEGDISAILAHHLPFFAQLKRTPGLSISLLKEWEEKIERISQDIVNKDVTHIIGVPSWTLLILKRVLEISGKTDLRSVWKHLELFVHGGVRFDPYQSQYRELIPHDDMHYLEVYNASEGFFAIQDRPDEHDMLLLLDHGVFYELMPMSELGKENPQLIGLEDVEIGKNYALVITTNGGLWRYVIGDTVTFTSTYPFRIRLTGRTKAFINLAGEEVMEDNATRAMAAACKACDAVVSEFSGAPFFGNEQQKPYHEWVVEFARKPQNIEQFQTIFDQTLRSLNSDYDVKRYKDFILQPPVFQVVPQNTFYHWMQERKKLGGQNKVPRLANDRKHVDALLEIAARNEH